jgi:hypothetical protein
MQINYVKISCKEDVHICRTNFAKKWNEICNEQLASRKHMENDCFSRALKFEMWWTIFLKFENYDLAISEVSHYGIFERTFFNKSTKKSYCWIQEKNLKKWNE